MQLHYIQNQIYNTDTKTKYVVKEQNKNWEIIHIQLHSNFIIKSIF